MEQGARNRIRAAAEAGRPAFGSWLTLPGSLHAELLAGPERDFLLIDLQHGAQTWDEVVRTIQAVELGGSQVVVRVGWNDEAAIMRALDVGAVGVVVPMVSTAADAARAAAACRFPPAGIRSFGTMRSVPDPEIENREALCLAMVETVEGLANAAEIAATPGVDGIFVGAIDLALSMGLPADFQAMPEPVLDAIDRVIAACRSAQKCPGTISLGPANAEDLLQRGIRLLTVGGDAAYLAVGAAQDAARIEQWARQYQATS